MTLFFFALPCTDTVTSSQDHQPRDSDSPTHPHPLQPQHHSPSILPEPSPGEDTHCTGSLVSNSSASSRALAQDTSSGPSPSSSPEIMMDHILESLDSEPEHDSIFLDFSRHCSGGSTHSRGSNRQSVAWHTLMQGHVQTMVSHDIPHTLLWHLLLFYGDSGSSGIISNWIIFTYRKTSNLMLTGKNINLAFSKCIPQFGNISKGLSGNHINHLTFTLDYRWVLLLSEMISLFYLMNEKLEKQTYSQQWWHFPGGRCTCFLFKTWATE